ncbi:MAG TPA: DUF1810 domain-containing protein [Rhizobacter sp.]|nr:DUF1810 domain-containing protein [Rhizobacter sp.]
MPEATDLRDLDRFVEAQAANYDDALAELCAGRKRTHWSWYVLPQLRGLGSSAMAVRYGIASLAEARAYLAHPLLGPRLRACVAAMNAHSGLSAEQILGQIDALKFRSCVTLFAQADATEPLFSQALATYFGGQPDPATLALLGRPLRL